MRVDEDLVEVVGVVAAQHAFDSGQPEDGIAGDEPGGEHVEMAARDQPPQQRGLTVQSR
jgi:hypothetical protein